MIKGWLIGMDNITLNAFDGSLIDNSIFFSALDVGFVFSCNLHNGYVQPFARLSNNIEIIDSCVYGNEIYLFAYLENSVYSINLETKEKRKISAEGSALVTGEEMRISMPIRILNRLYLFPFFRSRDFMIFDLDKGNLETHPDTLNHIYFHLDISGNEEVKVTKLDDCFVFFSTSNHFLVYTDMEFNILRTIKIGNEALIYDVKSDKDSAWVFLKNHLDVFRVYGDGKVSVYKNSNALFRGTYGDIIFTERGNILLPCDDPNIYIVDDFSKEIRIINNDFKLKKVKGNNRPMFNKHIYTDNGCYCIPLASDKMLFIDRKGNIRDMKMYIDRWNMNSIMKALLEDGIVFNEKKSLFTLDDFLCFATVM